jgi:hypothetical protein
MEAICRKEDWMSLKQWTLLVTLVLLITGLLIAMLVMLHTL